MSVKVVSDTTLRKEVEEEIRDHLNWCSKNCQTFLPGKYRTRRLFDGVSKESLQEKYDSCHAWR